MTSIQVRVNVDVDEFLGELSDLSKRQAPFALSRGLNAIALDAQSAMRKRIHRNFTVRRAQFIDRLVKIEQFAKKSSLYVRFGIAGPRADILTKFEAGGPRPTLSAHVALPIEAKRGKSGVIPRGQRPRALLSDRKAKRTFVIKTAGGRELLLQRVGKGKRSRTRVLYGFTPAGSVRIPASLGFERTVLGVINGRALAHIRREFDRVLANELPVGFGYSALARDVE